jgi:hypothetical protein
MAAQPGAAGAPQALVESIGAGSSSSSADVEQTLSFWFREADRDGDGAVSGVEAQRFFARSQPAVAQRALAKIWALSDQKREGFLSREAFGTAMRLLALEQQGRAPTLEARAMLARSCFILR